MSPPSRPHHSVMLQALVVKPAFVFVPPIFNNNAVQQHHRHHCQQRQYHTHQRLRPLTYSTTTNSRPVLVNHSITSSPFSPSSYPLLRRHRTLFTPMIPFHHQSHRLSFAPTSMTSSSSCHHQPTNHLSHEDSTLSSSSSSSSSHLQQHNSHSSDLNVNVTSEKTAHRLLRHFTPRRALTLACVILFLLFLRPTTQSATSLISSLTSYASGIGTTQATFLLFCLNFFTVLLCFPANMGLMIAAGAILPPLNAFSALFFSKCVAAYASFFLSRTLFQSRAQQALQRYKRLSTLLTQSKVDWRLVILLRLSPFPGFMLNYLLSLTGISFSQYALGSFFGIIPSVANLVLIGNAARDVGVGVGVGKTAGLATWVPIILKTATIASMIAVTVYVTRTITKAFDKDGKVAAAVAEPETIVDEEKTGHSFDNSLEMNNNTHNTQFSERVGRDDENTQSVIVDIDRHVGDASEKQQKQHQNCPHSHAHHRN